MQVIPAVDVLDGSVVRLEMGDFDKVTPYGEDPIDTARRWMQAGAGLIHVVDLEGARSGVPDVGLWQRMGAGGISFQVGGGIRSVEQARTALEVGASAVVLGSAAVWQPETLAGSDILDQVIGAVDVRHGRATGGGWLDRGRDIDEVVSGLVAVGLARMLVTAIGRDGTMGGPDLSLIYRVQDMAPGVRLIASGGVGSLEDLRRLADAGCEAVVVGRALYEGRFSLEEALAAAG